MLYYSSQAGHFYDSRIHPPKAIPKDAVELSEEAFNNLQRARFEGKRIVQEKKGGFTIKEQLKEPVAQRRKEALTRLEKDMEHYLRDMISLSIVLLQPLEYTDWLRDVVVPYYGLTASIIGAASSPEEIQWDFTICDQKTPAKKNFKDMIKDKGKKQ